MLTGQARNEVDKLWETFWTGGIANPLTVIEQITYLLFLRRLDQEQTRKEREAELLKMPIQNPIYREEHRRLRWSSFKDEEPEEMYSLFTQGIEVEVRVEVKDKDKDKVEGGKKKTQRVSAFDFMKNMAADDTPFAQYMKGATFLIPTSRLLDKAVQMISAIDMSGRDTKGDLYEYLLSKIATAGQNGQFRTPRHIIRMMVEMTQPTPDDRICDPAAGTAGFLVNAYEYLYERHKNEGEFFQKVNDGLFTGIEFDSSMIRIGAMNLMLHGIERPELMMVDALSESNVKSEAYTLILANPPFKGSLDYEAVEPSLLQTAKTKKTELLFLSLMLRMLQPGGRAAVIVPDGVLFGSSRAHKALRQEIVENQQLQAVISMPSGVFKPYAGVSTAVLFFTKTNSGGTKNVWFYDMQADGFSLDDKRNELGRRTQDKPEKLAPDEYLAEFRDANGNVVEYLLQKHGENNIPDILNRWRTLSPSEGKGEDSPEHARQRTEASFLVPFDEIKANDWDLSINRYKEIEYEAAAYDPPGEILAAIRKMDEEREVLMGELEKMLDT